jgi:outer membrane receptor protein involved in Fe transport
MKSASNWLDNLKLRLSWGKTGNSGINAYQTLATVSDNLYYYELDGTIYGGRIPDALGNEDLTWETTSSVDLGLDFGLWNNRLWGSIDFYWTRTKDLLYAKSVPATSVFPSVLSNIGKTRGHGVEIQIGGSPIRKKNFNWDATFTLSMARDKITELSEGVTQNIAADRTGQIVGQPVLPDVALKSELRSKRNERAHKRSIILYIVKNILIKKISHCSFQCPRSV